MSTEKLCNALPRKFDELMNSTKKYNRYESIVYKSFEAYKTKIKYVILLSYLRAMKYF
jgi:hypothetical protein